MGVRGSGFQGQRGIRCCWVEERGGERGGGGGGGGVGELSICTKLRICHVSGRVFSAATLRWF